MRFIEQIYIGEQTMRVIFDRKRRQQKAQLPQKIFPTILLPPAPACTNVTLPGQDTVEQNEAHHAAALPGTTLDVAEASQPTHLLARRRRERCSELG